MFIVKPNPKPNQALWQRHEIPHALDNLHAAPTELGGPLGCLAINMALLAELNGAWFQIFNGILRHRAPNGSFSPRRLSLPFAIPLKKCV